MKQTICLCGFKNVGKTTLGRQLSEILNVPFVDLDEELTKQFKQTPRQLYSACGELGFREREYEVLQKFCFEEVHILSLGGGTLSFQPTLELLQSRGHLVGLYADFKTVASRILASMPLWPILDAQDPLGSLKLVFEERQKLFNALSIPKFDTLDLNILSNLEGYVRKHIR